jgi:CRISPR-associated protein (TIGR02710 family)
MMDSVAIPRGNPQTVLIALVGESYLPIIRSINDNRPDFILFICSEQSRRLIDGVGDVCGNKRPCPHCGEPIANPNNPVGKSIVIQAELERKEIGYEPIIVTLSDKKSDPTSSSNPVDDLQSCLNAATLAFQKARQFNPEAKIVADYTGGTKTMSVALVRVATGQFASDRTVLSVVAGTREGLTAVLAGTESVADQQAPLLRLEDRWHEALRLANAYHYASACQVLTDITRQAPPSYIARKTERLLDVCQGLDNWHRFAHGTALTYLCKHETIVGKPLLRTLEALVQARTSLPHDDKPSSGIPSPWTTTAVLPVYDLLNNAYRHATHGSYDDAVMRLNRSVEMVAQIRLLCAHGINHNAVPRNEKTETWFMNRNRFRSGESRNTARTTGLDDTYDLLITMNDSVGAIYKEHRESLADNVQKLRNRLYIVHRTRAVTENLYEKAARSVEQYLDAVSKTLDEGNTATPFPAPPFPQLVAEQFG